MEATWACVTQTRNKGTRLSVPKEEVGQMALEIRDAQSADKQAWLPLWQGYQDFYQKTLAQEMTDLTWARIFDPDEQIFCKMACVDGRLVGFATYLFHRSTFEPESCCYLEDLFVAEDARGTGAAQALIQGVEQAARERGSGRLYWVTDAENERAQKAYRKVSTQMNYIQFRNVLD